MSGDGFVVYEEQKGFYVSPVSESDLKEIANLRILIESHALKYSLENSNPDWEGSLLAAHHKLNLYENKLLKNKTEERSNWKRYDSEFHQTLVRNCNSNNLIELHKLIFDKYLRYQLLVLTFRGVVRLRNIKNYWIIVLKEILKSTNGIRRAYSKWYYSREQKFLSIYKLFFTKTTTTRCFHYK